LDFESQKRQFGKLCELYLRAGSNNILNNKHVELMNFGKTHLISLTVDLILYDELVISEVVKMESTMGKWIFNEKCIIILQQTKKLKMCSPLAFNFDIDIAKIVGAIIGTKAYNILADLDLVTLLTEINFIYPPYDLLKKQFNFKGVDYQNPEVTVLIQDVELFFQEAEEIILLFAHKKGKEVEKKDYEDSRTFVTP